MIGLDTNVLLRLILRDSPAEMERAERLFSSVTPNAPLIVNPVVVHEVVWVLRRTLGWPKLQIMDVVRSLLDQDDLEIMQEDAVRRALAAWESGSAHFADYFIAEINAELGCRTTYTFDAKAARHPAFSPVP